jgi:hypothetical protein
MKHLLFPCMGAQGERRHRGRRRPAGRFDGSGFLQNVGCADCGATTGFGFGEAGKTLDPAAL